MKYYDLQKEMGMTEEQCMDMFDMSLTELWNESMYGLEELHEQGKFLDIKVNFVE